jgi:hypothetical protein
MMMFESMVESVLMCRAEIWGLKEQEEVERVQEESAGSESGKESGGKVWGQNGWKRRVQDTDGMLERKEKEHGEEREKEVIPEERICQWRSGKIESKRKMECGAEWKGQRHRQARKNGENQRSQIKQGVWKVYGRGNAGVPGERECKREKNDGKIQI